MAKNEWSYSIIRRKDSDVCGGGEFSAKKVRRVCGWAVLLDFAGQGDNITDVDRVEDLARARKYVEASRYPYVLASRALDVKAAGSLGENALVRH